MDHHAMEPTDFGYRELSRRLEAYADLRLTPSVAATTRMRTAVMNAAHRRAALIEADATFGAAGATTSALAAQRAAAARNAWRRPVAAMMAGCLTLAILAGTAFAARPGGPLYAARIWNEMANLPGNLVARAQAEVARLEDRLDEAQRASTAGDVSGTQAALAAYSTIVVEAAKGSAGDPAASAAIEANVTRHVAVLTLMVDSVPVPARAAAEQALTSTAQALDDLGGPAKSGHDDSKDAGGPRAGNDGSADGPGRRPAADPAKAAGPADADKADATDKHAQTDRTDASTDASKTGHNGKAGEHGKRP